MVEHKVKRPTLKTIASMTGLGVTTVSKALKDAPDIAVTTKQLVQQVAEQVGYQTDKAGLRLRTGKSNIISLVMNTNEEVDHITSDFIVGVTRALEGSSYNLILTPFDGDDDPLAPIRYVYQSQAADGVILNRMEPMDQRIQYLDKVGLPVATHGRSFMDLQHAYYDFDCEAFGVDAVQLLAKLGCKRPCMIFPAMHLSYAQLLQEGFYKGLELTELESYSMRSVTVEYPIEEIAEKVSSALSKRTRPDSFICCSGKSAIGTITGIEKAGFAIGRDIQVVVKQSKTNLLKWFGKPVYYVGEDYELAGVSVANCLLGILNGEPISKHQIVGYSEVVCRSVLE